MGLQARKIVEEEFNDILECQLPRNIWLTLISIRNRIKDRIEAECIKQDVLMRCACEEESKGYFRVAYAPGDVAYQELCDQCYENLRQDGFAIDTADRNGVFGISIPF